MKVWNEHPESPDLCEFVWLAHVWSLVYEICFHILKEVRLYLYTWDYIKTYSSKSVWEKQSMVGNAQIATCCLAVHQPFNEVSLSISLLLMCCFSFLSSSRVCLSWQLALCAKLIPFCVAIQNFLSLATPGPQ